MAGYKWASVPQSRRLECQHTANISQLRIAGADICACTQLCAHLHAHPNLNLGKLQLNLWESPGDALSILCTNNPQWGKSSDFCSEVSQYFSQTNTDIPPHLDFISLLIIIYSGILEAGFLALLLLCCGYQAVVHEHRGWLPRDRPGKNTPTRRCSAILLPWCCCLTIFKLAFRGCEWWKSAVKSLRGGLSSQTVPCG